MIIHNLNKQQQEKLSQNQFSYLVKKCNRETCNLFFPTKNIFLNQKPS